MNNKHTIIDYAEQEFIEFQVLINIENSAPTNKNFDVRVPHFRRVVSPPEGTDLLYYCSDENSTPEAITRIVKKWLAAHGKPGFKLQ